MSSLQSPRTSIAEQKAKQGRSHIQRGPIQSSDSQITASPGAPETPIPWQSMGALIDRIRESFAPVWPLKDYVAVNPYVGLAHQHFLSARTTLRQCSSCDMLMPLDYFASQFQTGLLALKDIEQVLQESKELDFSQLSLPAIRERLEAISISASPSLPEVENRLRPVSEYMDLAGDRDWSQIVLGEISKHCSMHYDEGQATWKSPWQNLPLYQAWREAAQHDFNAEILGLSRFRHFVRKLPHTPEAALKYLLESMKVPAYRWEAVLLAHAYSMPGWLAWTRYKTDYATNRAAGDDFAGLLAMRLAYECALYEQSGMEIRWETYPGIPNHRHPTLDSDPTAEASDVPLRYLLQRAAEVRFRDELLAQFKTSVSSLQHPEPTSATTRPLAQLVFCIDVRSERVRRHLEALSSEVETLGFAGFFALPFQYTRLGEETGEDPNPDNQLPVLLQPRFYLREGMQHRSEQHEVQVGRERNQLRSWRKAWRRFQSSAYSGFTFVESMGLTYAWKLLQRTLGWKGDRQPGWDGVDNAEHSKLGPTLRGLNQQGIGTTMQTDLAEAMLRGMGLISNFGQLVVFCGHQSQCENNPLQASLDCGACGGHSGEPNARLAAVLLNQPYIRINLRERGIDIPDDTYFVAGLHNTTLDEISLLDTSFVPQTASPLLERLSSLIQAAGRLAATERLASDERLASEKRSAVGSLLRMAREWSEVRPEWGLAGNAAFIAAPRRLTRTLDLDGRCFLHNYDHKQDTSGSLLEQIMTAPLVVANWINMQYYASTVDPQHFGCGDKTLHNVIGGFGILAGSNGDLQTGLPWQSLHTGSCFQHEPLRLQAMIAAPRQAIDRVLENHESLAQLVEGNWLYLIAIEDNQFYQRQANGTWEAIAGNPSPNHSVTSLAS